MKKRNLLVYSSVVIVFLLISLSLYFKNNFLTSMDETLNLSGKNLQKLPESTLEMKELKNLLLSPAVVILNPLSDSCELEYFPKGRNYLEFLPEEISQLTKLEVLNLAFNNLKTLPKSITSLDNLYFLDISNNEEFQLETEAEKIAELKSLKHLALRGLNCRKLPSILSNCNSLEEITLSSMNSLDLDDALQKLSKLKLKFIAIEGLCLKKLPKNLLLFDSIETLVLSNNNLDIESTVNTLKEMETLKSVYMTDIHNSKAKIFQEKFPNLNIITN